MIPEWKYGATAPTHQLNPVLCFRWNSRNRVPYATGCHQVDGWLVILMFLKSHLPCPLSDPVPHSRLHYILITICKISLGGLKNCISYNLVQFKLFTFSWATTPGIIQLMANFSIIQISTSITISRMITKFAEPFSTDRQPPIVICDRGTSRMNACRQTHRSWWILFSMD